MTKSQQYFQDMMEVNSDAFTAFKEVHDKYAIDPKKYQQEFNEIGEKVMLIIRKYENLLCNFAEGGKYGKFSSNTAETFWNLIRKAFPKIDFVGIKV